MESRETLLLAMAIVSAFLLSATSSTTDTEFDADSWDMAVMIGNEIHFFKNDTEIRYFTVANVYDLRGLAYDSANRTLYVSGRSNTSSRGNIYYSDLVEGNLNLQPMLNNSEWVFDGITSMAIDPMNKTLFWTTNLRFLYKMESASYGIGTEPQILQVRGNSISYGIALDICHRFIYWGDEIDWVYSIKRSNLDGTDTTVIISDGLAQVLGLAVDHYGGKLYFSTIDRNDLTTYTIEESNLDGTGRRVLVNDTNLLPLLLAVDDTAVYWISDQSVWKVYKNGTEKSEIKSFEMTHPGDILSSIITRYNVGDIDCKAVLNKEQIRTPEPLPAQNQSDLMGETLEKSGLIK